MAAKVTVEEGRSISNLGAVSNCGTDTNTFSGAELPLAPVLASFIATVAVVEIFSKDMLTFSAGVFFFGIETVGLVSVGATSVTETELVVAKASATADTLSTVVGTLPDTSSNVIVVV